MSDFNQSLFLEKFGDKKVFKEADVALGKPTLITATFRDSPVIIKCWQRDTQRQRPDDILEDIWLYEIRQLRRLKGYPGLGNYIANLVEADRDQFGFYLVIDAGHRLPLSHYLIKNERLTLNPPWVKKLQDPQKRIRFWSNVRRIVSALQLLHSQGLLHRHLDEDAILTDIHSYDSDFQLTGFEWSIRVQTMSSVEVSEYPSGVLKSGGVYSFLTDWNDLGKLIARVLKVNLINLCDLKFEIKLLIEESGLTLDEINLLRGLLGVINLKANMSKEGINGRAVDEKITDVIDILSSLVRTDRTDLDIVFHMNTNNSSRPSSMQRPVPTFSAIQKIYKELYRITLGVDDTDECLNFIKTDLKNNPRVVVCSSDGENTELLLLGEQLTYILSPNKLDSSDIANWESAFCHTAYIEPPKNLNSNSDFIRLNNYNLRYFLPYQYRTESKRDSISWEDIIYNTPAVHSDDSDFQDIIDGFSAYHLMEIAYLKSEIYPISIVQFERNKSDSSLYDVLLSNRPDHDSQILSSSLGIRAPAKRLYEHLTNENLDSLSWILASNTNFQDTDEIVLEFQKIKHQDGEDLFLFTTSSHSPNYAQYYLIPLSVQGTIKQLNRRAAAIDALGNHEELIGMLADPYAGNSQLKEDWRQHETYSSLDPSKQKAFSAVMGTLPLYLVQGPPGVGKTFLVTSLMQQIFSEEIDSRILLTAQSHSTVQHLYKEVMRALRDVTDIKNSPLVVSCIKSDEQDDSESESLNALDTLALNFIQELIKSPLYHTDSSSSAKSDIIRMAEYDSRSARYSLIGQILRAANIVFATTNSRYVEELINGRSQFDWSIMEETGKVTGIELLSPLLLSYRRLMIGDHKQLPPFASEEMKEILEVPGKLLTAIKAATEVNNNTLKGEIIKKRFTDDFVNSLTPEQVNHLSRNSRRLHLLFESLIGEELLTKERSINHFGSDVRHRPIATMLSIQHRMHPDIASLVSQVFYEGGLKTSDEKAAFYREPSNRPFTLEGLIPSSNVSSIIWVETPDKQTCRQFKTGERQPRWQNTYESRLVVEVLKKLKATSSRSIKPKLAVLSPYAQQVKLLSKEIEKCTSNHELQNLEDFDKPDDHTSFCSTVDGFQGAEADIVIISLVRNNHHSYAKSALGFLLDSRRMNVLLSRAKHQLVIVGSLQFLQHWANKIKKEELDKGVESNRFLFDLVSTLISYKEQGLVQCIPAESLISKS